MSSATDILCKSLIESPHDWTFSEHRAINNVTNFHLWIGNGMVFIDVMYPFTLNFNIVQKYRIWTAIRYAKEQQLRLKFTIL